MFNTLLYTKKLEAVGLKRDVAEAHVQMLAEVIETNLATKQDLKDLENRLIIRLGGLMFLMTAFSITTTVALIKFL